MKSHDFDLNDLQIMSSDDALLINGGMILSTGAFWSNVSEGWSSFKQGIQEAVDNCKC